jgi:N-acetylglucosamine-6-phosphate deacetylase
MHSDQDTSGRRRRRPGRNGGSIVGIHLEGPFLNPAKRGSHHSEYLPAPDVMALRHLLAAGEGTVRVATLTPELPERMDLLRGTLP